MADNKLRCTNCGAERREYTDRKRGQVKLLGGNGMCAACYQYWLRHKQMRVPGKPKPRKAPSIPRGKMCDCGHLATVVFRTTINISWGVTYYLCEDCWQLEQEMRAEYGS